MHEIEDYIEEAIRVVSRSDMPVSEKRSMIYSLLRLEEYGDCGLPTMRTLKEMMDCQYTFVFDKTEMYDYEANRGYYDEPFQERAAVHRALPIRSSPVMP